MTDSTSSTVLGAAVGAAFGFLLGQWDEGRKVAVGGAAHKNLYVGGSTAVFAIVGGYIGRGLASPATVAATPTTLPAPTATSLVPALQNVAAEATALVDVQVAPNATLNVAAAVGAPVIVWPALGGRWVSVDGAPVANNVAAPFAFQMAGAISHTYVWTDTATNTTQTCTINFTVAPPVVVATI
jgi:hypothetical protein